MSPKLPRFSAQAILLVALSLMLVLIPTLGTVFAQGLDLNRHCIEHGRANGAVTVGTTAYDIKCQDSSGVNWDISIQSACDEQYGSGTVARYSDFNNPYSWYCEAPASQQQNDDTGGQVSQPQPQQQPQSSYSGGMDIAGWCVSQGRSGATFTGDAYSWYCTNSDGSRATDINVDAVCVYSSGGSHPYAGFTDINNPYSWYCATTPQGRPSSGGNPAPQPTPVPQTNPSFNYCDFTPVSVGQTAQITAGRSNRLRSGAGIGYSQIGSLQPGTQFSIVSGPTCANGYNWYGVSLSNGTTGYTAAGSYGDPWIEPVSGTGANGPQTTDGPTGSNSNRIQSISTNWSGLPEHTEHVGYGEIRGSTIVNFDYPNGQLRIRGVSTSFESFGGIVNIACYSAPEIEIQDANGNTLFDQKGPVAFSGTGTSNHTNDFAVAPMVSVESSTATVMVHIAWDCMSLGDALLALFETDEAEANRQMQNRLNMPSIGEHITFPMSVP